MQFACGAGCPAITQGGDGESALAETSGQPRRDFWTKPVNLAPWRPGLR